MDNGYWVQIMNAYDAIKNGRYNKSIIEDKNIKVTIYQCGTIIRIDVKEKA